MEELTMLWRATPMEGVHVFCAFVSYFLFLTNVVVGKGTLCDPVAAVSNADGWKSQAPKFYWFGPQNITHFDR
jgi:hypothetical protein